MQTIRKTRPPMNEPVSFSTVPSTYGPMNPPRFPTELMNPMLPAAAVPPRNKLGSDQNAGRYALNPAYDTMNPKTVRARLPRLAITITSPTAAAAIGTAVWNQRSFDRSELQPTPSCPITASSGGRMTSQVRASNSSEYQSRRMLGMKNSTP